MNSNNNNNNSKYNKSILDRSGTCYYYYSNCYSLLHFTNVLFGVFLRCLLHVADADYVAADGNNNIANNDNAQ